MASSRKTLSLSAALLIILALGAGIYFKMQKEDGPESADGSGSSAISVSSTAAEAFSTNLAIPVEAAEVIHDTLVISVSASGEAAALRQTIIKAQVAGRVEQILVQENARITSTSLLVQIDTTEVALEVERALAQKRSAEANFRESILFDDRIEDPVIRAERESVARAKSGLDAAEITLRKAQIDLSRSQIRAPFGGRVASLQIVPGQWVSPGDQLMTIVDLERIKVEVQVLESEIGYLEPGRRARISFSAFPDEVFQGRIETINPIIEQATRTAKVTVLVENPDGRILPGMHARVSLDARRFPDRILVPRAAILERDRRAMLFVFEDGFAKWRYVTTGLENESQVEILEHPETDMVRPGELVLVRGHYSLRHDAMVRIVQSVREAGGGRPD